MKDHERPELSEFLKLGLVTENFPLKDSEVTTKLVSKEIPLPKKLFSLEDKLTLMHKVDSEIVAKVATAMVQSITPDEVKKK